MTDRWSGLGLRPKTIYFSLALGSVSRSRARAVRERSQLLTSLALKSPVSSLASRQDEIANFVSRFHGILGGRASAREKRKRTRDSFFILWLSRVIPFPFLGLQADSR